MCVYVYICLQDAAANNRLTSATYQRLMVACVFKNVGFLLAFAQVGANTSFFLTNARMARWMEV